MTVARPLFEEALLKLMGQLTAARCSEIIGRPEGFLHDASNPNRPHQLMVRDMIALDKAHLEYDGTAPLFAALGAIIAEARAAIYKDAVAIRDATHAVLKEDGEAHVALFAACEPSATDQELLEALREARQAVAAQTSAIEVLLVALKHRGRLPP
jgi:hypothetical protein